MNDVEFIEDKKYFSKLEPKEKVPEAGFEGWFYKKIPGKYYTKKVVLVAIIIFLFVLSGVFFMLGKFNRGDIDALTFIEHKFF